MASAFAGDETAARLIIRETAPGAEPVQHRILVNHDFLRMDIVGDKSGFLLLDRKQRLIHNINLDDNTDLLINKNQVTLAPPAVFAHKTVALKATLPKIDGHVTRRYQISTNQTLCHDVVVVEGILKDAAKAMMEFADALSSEQAIGLAATPKEFVNECELATGVFEPGREYARGFPVREQDWRGRLRELVDYDEHYKADASLFTVPDGMLTMNMQEMRAN